MRIGTLGAFAVALLLLAGIPATSQAQQITPETPSWGAANLISANDSDFEASLDWTANGSNTTVSLDTTSGFHGGNSMLMTAKKAGSMSAKMGIGQAPPLVPVAAGDTYRESAWVEAPAVGGRKVIFAGRFWNAAGQSAGRVTGTAVALGSSGGWQYASALITAPRGAAYLIPAITETGVSAGETLDVDEVVVEPYRAATMIGAKDPSTDASQFSSANGAIGPLQDDKLFYLSALPATYAGSSCASLPAAVTCVLAWYTPDVNVASFVSSVPAGRNTIFVWWNEPALTYPGTGAQFVSEFEAQSTLIRSSTTAVNRASIWVADNDLTYEYDPGSSHDNGGNGCAFTVPSQYVDFYLADAYENPADGNNLATTAYQSPLWKGWLSCVLPQDKPIGLAEYGLNCTTSPDYANGPTTYTAMAADSTYLARQSFTPGGSSPSYVRPVVMWSYWWYDNGASCQFTTGGTPDGTQAVQQWQANETQNGGGAN